MKTRAFGTSLLCRGEYRPPFFSQGPDTSAFLPLANVTYSLLSPLFLPSLEAGTRTSLIRPELQAQQGLSHQQMQRTDHGQLSSKRKAI